MSLRERLDGYEVTVVPGPARLRLAWSVAQHPADHADDLEEAPPRGEESASLALLGSYRITRVPVRAAS